MVSRDVQAAIIDESAAYHVPVWITRPLVMAESGGNPNARNGSAVGLMQITPTFPGASGRDLTNPTVNLDVGLRQIAAYLSKHPEDAQKSLTSFEDVISHTGWDTTLGWAQEGVGEQGTTPAAVKRNYINAYNTYGKPGGSNIDVGGALGQVGNAAGNAAGQVGNKIDQTAGQVACDAFAALPMVGVFAPIVCPIAGELADPKKAILLLVAFLVLIAAAFHVFDKGSGTVLQVQAGAGQAVRAGGAIKKGAGAVGRLGATAAEVAAV